MDRKTWIAVALSIVGLILWQQYYLKPATQRQLEAQKAAALAAAQQVATPTPIPADTPVEPSATANTGSTPAPPNPPRTGIERRTESLSTEDAKYVFQNDTGGIEQVVLLKHLGEEDADHVVLNADPESPIGAFGTVPGEVLGGFTMSVDAATNAVVFQKTESDGLLIEKRFVVPAMDDKSSKYTVNLEVKVRNTGKIEISRPAFFISTGAASAIHSSDMPTYTRFDWYQNGKMQGIDVNWFPAGHVPILGIQTRPAREMYKETGEKVAWAAVASQYFCTIVTAENPIGNSVWARRFDMHRSGRMGEVYGIQGGLGFAGFSLAPGQERAETFRIYSGPKEYATLSRMEPGQKAVMNFGFFGVVSEFLLWALHWLHNLLFNNYGVAIIALTLIIKSCLWPLQNIATNSMRRMAALAPKMTEIREKYKDDPQKLNTETMKLYREYGVNPFSGCLPMLIQIPIFFGFYTMLGSSVELRDSPFLWIHDLSQPDTVAHLFGFPINLLPLVMAVSMIWQMAITPKTGDAVQQRIMYFMPVVFLIFCYNYASGLALYWTTQNIFSIVQLYLTRNKPLPTLEKKSVIAKREAGLTKKKKKKP